jgi:hypothetical protein
MRMSRLSKLFSLGVSLLLATSLLTSCGDGGNDTYYVNRFEPLVLGTLSTETGNTSFRQTVAMEDADTFEYFPGQANIWDISSDFSLSDGGDDQFDGVMYLNVDGNSFPSQNYSDLTFYTPAFGTKKGVKVAAVVERVEQNYRNSGPVDAISGTYSAYLNDIHDGRLYQSVNLTGATAPIALSWNMNINVNSGDFGMPAYLRVVVRNPVTMAILETLNTQSSSTSGSFNADLSAYAGQTVSISFEISSNGYGPNLIDDVSLTDGAATQYIANGTFETGDLTGWTTNDPAELQNMTSGQESMSGLTVSRSFYTVPNKVWGRWVDVFKNETAAPITTTVEYQANLGSDDSGILYLTPGTDGKSLTGWDGDTQEDPPDATSSSNDRDFAFVFGNVDSVDFTSATAIGADDGDDNITHRYTITVAPGQSVAIVNFILMNGIDTGATATDASARATAIDAAAKAIVVNFWRDGQYRSGMTQEQIDAIINF